MAWIRSRPHVAAEVYVAVLYAALSLFLIHGARGGAPFVFDGNETFSSLLHARNLAAFGPGLSAGLADESTSPLRDAHAVVHSHQGNFPRLYASLLYVLGATSPQAQVLLTTLPAGLLSVLMLFAVLRRLLGSGAALASMTVLLTDYVLFMQWQVVTYRVWYTFFFASTFFLAERWRERASWSIGGLMVATWAGLFYFELVFAVFLATSVAVFTIWRLGSLRRSIGPGLLQASGAMIGVLLVISQGILYLGWEGFLTDLHLTYLGRNTGSDDLKATALIKKFVDENNIAFFYNFIDSQKLGLRSLRFFLDILFKWGFQVYTPALTCAIVLLASGVLTSIFAKQGRVRRPRMTIVALASCLALSWIGGSFMPVCLFLLCALAGLLIWGADRRQASQLVSKIDAAVLVGTPAFILILFSIVSPSFLGFIDSRSSGAPYAVFLVIGGIGLLVAFIRFSPLSAVPLDAAVRSAAVLTIAVIFIRYHANLYDKNFAPIWIEAIPGVIFPVELQRGCIFLAAALAAGLAGMFRLGNATREQMAACWRGAGIIITSCLAGLIAALIFSPGYIYSGYMVRFNNFLPVIFAVFIGTTAFTTVAIVWNLPLWREQLTRRLIRVAATGVVCIVGAGWWLSVELSTYLSFPPNGFAILDALRQHAAGRSLIATSYPAPFSLAVGNWGYLDHAFAEGKRTFSPHTGWSPVFDYKYRWFADRARNPAYDRPSMFVCFVPFSYGLLAQQLTVPGGAKVCGGFGLVQLAQAEPDGIWPDHRIVAADPSGRDLWTIVRLDWDFSPILRQSPDMKVTRTGDQIEAAVTYAFYHQNGDAEAGTEIELRAVTINSGNCALERDVLARWTGQGGDARIVLPPSGKLIVSVRVRTATRSSEAVYLRPFSVDGESVDFLRPCMSVKDEIETTKMMDRP